MIECNMGDVCGCECRKTIINGPILLLSVNQRLEKGWTCPVAETLVFINWTFFYTCHCDMKYEKKYPGCIAHQNKNNKLKIT